MFKGVGANELQFEWDDAKAASNLEKHGVSFEAAAAVFADHFRLEEDDTFARGEYRTIAIGAVGEFILTIVYTEADENLVRLISARQATANERKAYEENIFHP